MTSPRQAPPAPGPPQGTAGAEALAELAEALRGWDGSAEEAARLRERIRALPEIRRAGATVQERAILFARSAYAAKKPPELGRLKRDPELAVAMGPFLGDPAMGEWPFDAPLLVGDAEAMGWLPLLAVHAAIDARVRTLVRTMFRSRRREVWLVASRAFARLATRDAEMRAALVEEWRASMPAKLGRDWAGGRLGAAKKDAAEGEEDRAHAARRVLHAACAWLAEGGDGAELGEGVSAARIAAMPLPKHDASDASAVLLALAALVRGAASRSEALAHVAKRVAEAPCHPLVDEALRPLAEAAGDAEERGAVERRLAEPRWMETRRDERIDGLVSWVSTAAWFHAAGNEQALAAMRGASGEAEGAVRLSVLGLLPEGEHDAVLATVVRLRIVLDDDAWLTTPDAERARAMGELLFLLEREEVRGLEWARLARRAVGGAGAFASAGTVGEVARADLALTCASRREHPSCLLRDVRFDADAVLRLARSQDGYLARQVALEMERLLREAEREAAPEEARARLLWKLLERDPPTLTFRELSRNLRGRGTKLHAVVAALTTLDTARDAKRSVGEIAAAYVELASATCALVGEGSPAAALLAPIAESLVAVAALGPPSVDPDHWLAALSLLLFGASGDAGLDAWMRWLGAPMDALRARWRRFSRAVGSLRETRPLVDSGQHAELDAAAMELLDAVRAATWPEGLAVTAALAAARAWAEELRAEARLQAEAALHVEKLLDRGDERAISELVARAGDPTLDRLHPDLLRRVSRFLLRRLRFRAAARLRARVRDRVQLAGAGSHLAPLLMGATSGPFLILQGGPWNELVRDEHAGAYAATVITALVLPYLVLASSVAPAFATAARESPLARFARACLRVLPTYLLSLAIAYALSGVLLVTLEGTASVKAGDDVVPWDRQLALWGGVSLFLGMFLGLIFQGRGAFREGED